MAASKTVCPITREQFRQQAKAVQVTINGVPVLAEVKEFSTGSLGWFVNGKTVLQVGDTPVSVQVGLNTARARPLNPRCPLWAGERPRPFVPHPNRRIVCWSFFPPT
jgi:hypothetical protein